MRTHMPLGGPELEIAIRETPAIRPALIDNLVLEESSVIVHAPYGSGKTTILVSVVAPSSIGQPVFGQLACSRPLRSYIFCPERSAKEIKERFRRLLDAGYPMDLNNIQIDDGMTGAVEFCDNPPFLRGTNGEIWQGIDHAIANRFLGNKPDIFFVEGLYAMSRKSMADADFAQFLMRFNRELYRRYGTSTWYSSHTKKQQRTQDGDLMDLDDYGGVLIMAQVTGAYLFRREGEKTSGKSSMTQKKDTVSGMADKLAFTYDAECGLLKLDSDSPLITAHERFRLYLNNAFRIGHAVTYADLLQIGGVSQSTVAREIKHWVEDGSLVNTAAKGAPGSYRVKCLV